MREDKKRGRRCVIFLLQNFERIHTISSTPSYIYLSTSTCPPYFEYAHRSSNAFICKWDGQKISTVLDEHLVNHEHVVLIVVQHLYDFGIVLLVYMLIERDDGPTTVNEMVPPTLEHHVLHALHIQGSMKSTQIDPAACVLHIKNHYITLRVQSKYSIHIYTQHIQNGHRPCGTLLESLSAV